MLSFYTNPKKRKRHNFSVFKTNINQIRTCILSKTCLPFKDSKLIEVSSTSLCDLVFRCVFKLCTPEKELRQVAHL